MKLQECNYPRAVYLQQVLFVLAVISDLVFDAPVSLMYMLVLLPALVFFCLSQERLFGRALLPLVVYLAYVLGSSLWGGGLPAVSQGLKYAVYIVAFLYACALFRRKESSVPILMVAMCGSIVFVILYSVAFYMSKYGVIGFFETGVRLRGVIGVENPIYVSIIVMLVFLYLMSSHVAFGWKFIALALVALLLMAPFQSRGPMLAFAVGLVAILAGRRQYWPLIICTMLVVVLGLLLYLNIDRFSTVGYPRLSIWLAALDRVLHQCSVVWGCGFGYDFNIVVGSHSYAQLHSLVLSQFFYGGVFGFVLFLATMAFYAGRLFVMRSPWLGVLVGGLVTLLTMRHEILSNPDISWYVLWLPLGLSGVLLPNKYTNSVVSEFYGNHQLRT